MSNLYIYFEKEHTFIKVVVVRIIKVHVYSTSNFKMVIPHAAKIAHPQMMSVESSAASIYSCHLSNQWTTNM